jgi:hypothetical protein
MLRKISTILALALAVALLAQPASADFFGLDAPDWSGNDYYTNQTWTFTNAIDFTNNYVGGSPPTGVSWNPGVTADAGYVNANGAADMYYSTIDDVFVSGSTIAWDWMDQGPMGQNWDPLQGMVGGMGEGSFDFYVPIYDVADTTSIWLQYISFIPNGSDGSDVDALLASNSGITNLVGSQTSKTYAQIHELDDKGGTGEWWRITEQWEVDNAGDDLYVRVAADVDGTANMIDSVQVVTAVNPVDVPAVSWPILLLASGMLGVMGLRRQRSH